ncbi:hypothetical protein E2562_033239 [Oryza meyeriana var. granulata]|uniref:Uncharacterized protein n=1 Tax=Oryza meyeriana var. granulata TaxID=110450 RepID=A0A6G1BPI0_9ORYZ|nr:hypothetical protein E2562_033239 [Oryza meyeriana var. granulata]
MRVATLGELLGGQGTMTWGSRSPHQPATSRQDSPAVMPARACIIVTNARFPNRSPHPHCLLPNRLASSLLSNPDPSTCRCHRRHLHPLPSSSISP